MYVILKEDKVYRTTKSLVKAKKMANDVEKKFRTNAIVLREIKR